MSRTPAQLVVDRLRQAVEVEKAADSDLLDAFVGQRSECAFAELVRRHGPMVWGVCGRMLPSRVDAEDCYQATFLVLVRKADTVRPRSRIGAWLHGVAFHTALKARHLAAKRGHMELQVERLPEPITKPDPSADLRHLLDRGLSELPEKYRVAIVLCDLEGRTLKDVAQDLGCPLGTLAGWLTRGRDLLARRLARHSVPAGAAAIAARVAETASAAPPVLALTSASPAVLTLAEATMRTLFLAKLQTWLIATAAALVVTFGLGGGIYYAGAGGANADAPPGKGGNEAREVVDADQGRDQAVSEEPKIAWGQAVEGIEYGIAFKEKRNAYRIGEDVIFVLKARNVSGKAVSFDQAEIRNFDGGTGVILPIFADAKGKEKTAFGALIPDLFIPARVRKIELAAKETATLGEVGYRVGPFDNVQAGIDVAPGSYRVRFDTVCPGFKRPTGTLAMVVLEKEEPPRQKARLIDLYEKIKPGMTRKDVEAILGKAIVENDGGDGSTRVYYLGDEYRERNMLSHESPFMPTGMRVSYAAGKVTEKQHNFQWVLEPAWGGAVDGVECGVEFKDRRNAYRVGEFVTLVVKARNLTDQPKEFAASEINRLGPRPKLVDGAGKKVEIFPQLKPDRAALGMQTVKLGPRETVTLGKAKFTVGSDGIPYMLASPGSLRIQYENISARDDAQQRATGVLGMIVLDRCAWGKAIAGIEYGFEFKAKNLPNRARIGAKAVFILKARNITDKPVTIEQVDVTAFLSITKDGKSGFTQPIFIDGQGKETPGVPGVLPGDPHLAAVKSVKIDAGQAVVLGEVAYTLGKSDSPPFVPVEPGMYQVRFNSVSWLPGQRRPTASADFHVMPK